MIAGSPAAPLVHRNYRELNGFFHLL